MSEKHQLEVRLPALPAEHVRVVTVEAIIVRKQVALASVAEDGDLRCREVIATLTDDESHGISKVVACLPVSGVTDSRSAPGQQFELQAAELAKRLLVVEELGDFYNLKMMSDKTINPLVAKINKVHHVDEARHLSFGRELLRELAADICPKWSSEQRRSFESWLADYLGSSWGDFYNPSMYKDAGLEGAYNVRKMALAHPACAEFRARASEKLVDYFLDAGLLSQRPSH